jgi:hypothetical protein
VYASEDIATFIRRFGYADRNGVEDRMNFGGVHRVGERCDATGLTMELRGYDAARSRITDPHGFLALVDAEQTVAASWSFRKILEHWSRKHARAVYVPSNSRTDPVRQYRYGPSVRMAEKTDALRLLKALASRAVYYDPGIKLERASTESPSHKKRSQFRVSSKNIGTLYETVLVEKV